MIKKEIELINDIINNREEYDCLYNEDIEAIKSLLSSYEKRKRKK